VIALAAAMLLESTSDVGEIEMAPNGGTALQYLISEHGGVGSLYPL
jgi:hypothetical protein